MIVERTGIKYRNTLISEAVFTSKATYHRIYPTTVGNNAKKRTALHPVQDNVVASVINDDERKGNRPRDPKRKA